MKGRVAALLIVTLLACWLLVPISEASASPEITDIILTNTARDLIVYATLRNGFSDQLVEAIQSGVPTTFTYYLDLYRRRELWWDALVASRVIKNSVKYDLLKKEYHFTRSFNGTVDERTTKSLEELESWMSELENVPLTRYHSLIPQDRYYVRVKAELKTTKLFFPLNYIFFFVSFLDQKTGWYESPVFTVRGPLHERR